MCSNSSLAVPPQAGAPPVAMAWLFAPLFVVVVTSLSSTAFVVQTMSTHPISPLSGRDDSIKRTMRAVGLGITSLPIYASAKPSDAERGPTNEVVSLVDGIRRKRLGSSDIMVSELALGTQRWCSDDFNAPSEELCYRFMDRAILQSGVNLIDTAEQYPIPSSQKNPEGTTELVIGKWMAQAKGRREKVVIATKITGGTLYNIPSIYPIYPIPYILYLIPRYATSHASSSTGRQGHIST